MLFSYNWLQEFFKTKLPSPEKLAELLAFHAFEVEGVEKKRNDHLIDVSILPQRGDCLSHRGIAREISAITGFPMQEFPAASVALPASAKPLKVSIAASKYVPRFCAFVVEGVAIGSSPQWIQERLASLGVNSINNVVDITNYVMLELGQPLHAFDYEKIRGQKMVVRQARAGEKIQLLDDQALTLQKGAMVIEDAAGLIDLAGIRGGKASSITGHTKSIVLQAAVFDRQKIYQTKKALAYSTQAAEIYAHGVDPNFAHKALERAFYLLLRFGGGKAVQRIDFYPSKKAQKIIAFPAALTENLLGIAIQEKESKKILARLGFSVAQKKVKVPSWRQDISLPQDLVEEVGRIYGYENIQPAFPEASIAPPETNMDLFWQERMKDILKEAGCTETYNYSFQGKNSTAKTDAVVELENPISEDFEYLRPSLLHNLLKDVSFNKKIFPGKDIKIFEIGNVFEKTANGLVEERTKIGGAVFGKEAFYAAKGIVSFFFSRLGISKVWYNEDAKEKGCANIAISSNKIGILKEVFPQVSAFELDFSLLVEHASQEQEYASPSRFPAALRDIALFVPRALKVQEVLNTIERSGGELVAGIDLFDTYEGEESQGKKSLAFHIVFQSKERTLTNEEVDLLQKNIIKALEENQGWQVRA